MRAIVIPVKMVGVVGFGFAAAFFFVLWVNVSAAAGSFGHILLFLSALMLIICLILLRGIIDTRLPPTAEERKKGKKDKPANIVAVDISLVCIGIIAVIHLFFTLWTFADPSAFVMMNTIAPALVFLPETITFVIALGSFVFIAAPKSHTEKHEPTQLNLLDPDNRLGLNDNE